MFPRSTPFPAGTTRRLSRLALAATLTGVILTGAAPAGRKPIGATSGVGILLAQSAAPSTVQPLRTAPAEKMTVKPGFRDWSATTAAGTLILGGNMTGKGGLFAIDQTTGKVKWSFRPLFKSGTAAMTMAPAVSGTTVIASFPTAYPGATIGLTLATGKELWRGPDPASGVATTNGLALIVGKNGTLYALDAATGTEKWTAALSASTRCTSTPVARGNTVYVTAFVDTADAGKAKGHLLFALDAATGAERWRYRAEGLYAHDGVCLQGMLAADEAIYATGDNHLYAIDRETGRNRWKAIDIRRPADRQAVPEFVGLVDAGTTIVGLTVDTVFAFDKQTGRMAWELPGQYRTSAPSTAVAGGVLYFQGSPKIKPAAAPGGTLHALDLETREILWSFSRPTDEPNWSFGFVTPVDGALWVDSYGALVKLQ